MTWLIVVLVIAAVVAIAVLAVPQLRSRSLKQRFGSEYERLVDDGGDRRSAEAELRSRVKRRDSLDVHDLDPAARDAYAEEWLVMQQRFIDDPSQTVAEADALVQTVMRQRGYPVEDFDERIDMVSVDHPELTENYRVAHAIQRRSEEQDASTDDLREAFQRYRLLFAELLADGLDPDVRAEHGNSPPEGDAR